MPPARSRAGQRVRGALLATPQDYTQAESMTKQRQSILNGTELNGSTELRLHNQLTRAFTNSFGAEQGLHELVKLATMQMLATGTSRAAIRNALIRVVNDHAAYADSGGLRTRGATLSAMMLEWSDCTESEGMKGGGRDDRHKSGHNGGHKSGHTGGIR